MVEIGFTFFQESLTALLRFIQEVVEHRRITSQLLNTSLSVQFRIQSCLDHTQGNRTAFHHFLCPCHTLVFQLLQGHHLVHHTHFQSFLSRVLSAHKPYLACLFLSYDTSQITASEARIKRTHLRTRLSEDSILRGNRQVAHQVQHVSTPNGITVHHRYHGLWQTANLHLHIQHTQTGHALIIHISATPFHVHIATRAKRMFHVCERFTLRHFRHSPRQQHYSDLLHLTAHGESLRQFQCCLRCKRIPVVRPINSNLRNTMIFFEENFLEFPNLFPFSLHHISFIFRIYVQRYD